MIKVHQLKVSNKSTFINYTYLVVNTIYREALLIDPGWEFDTIKNYLISIGADLKGILLTHHHADHTQLASDFANEFNIPVYMSVIEMDFYNFKCANLQPVLPDQVFHIYRFNVFAHHTPGHTKGSLCFQVDDNLFTGRYSFCRMMWYVYRGGR